VIPLTTFLFYGYYDRRYEEAIIEKKAA